VDRTDSTEWTEVTEQDSAGVAQHYANWSVEGGSFKSMKKDIDKVLRSNGMEPGDVPTEPEPE